MKTLEFIKLNESGANNVVASLNYFKSLYYNKVNSVMIVVANVLQGER